MTAYVQCRKKGKCIIKQMHNIGNAKYNSLLTCSKLTAYVQCRKKGKCIIKQMHDIGYAKLQYNWFIGDMDSKAG